MAFCQVDLVKYKGKDFVAIASVRLLLDGNGDASSLYLEGIQVIKSNNPRRKYELRPPGTALGNRSFYAFDLRGGVYKSVRTAVLNRLRETEKSGKKRIVKAEGSLQTRVINSIAGNREPEEWNRRFTGKSPWSLKK